MSAAALKPVPNRPKLLFVDDHHVLTDALTFIASPEFDVVSVDNLSALPKVVNGFDPDLVILDVRMPDGDAMHVARELITHRPGLKVVFLSMYSEPSYVRRALETGAQAYLSKKASSDELLEAIRMVLNGEEYISPHLQVGLGAGEIPLTERQTEVLRLISRGCSAKEIANELNISVRTAEFHRAAIMNRLKLHSTAMMTRYAVEQGID